MNPLDPESYAWLGYFTEEEGLRRDLDSFGTAVRAFVPEVDGPAGYFITPLGTLLHSNEARAKVAGTYARLEANSALPAPLKTGLEVLGPPTSNEEALLVLGASAIGGGLAARTAAKTGATGAALARIFGVQALKDTAAVFGIGAALPLLSSSPTAPTAPKLWSLPTPASGSALSRPVLPVALAVLVVVLVAWRR